MRMVVVTVSLFCQKEDEPDEEDGENLKKSQRDELVKDNPNQVVDYYDNSQLAYNQVSI